MGWFTEPADLPQLNQPGLPDSELQERSLDSFIWHSQCEQTWQVLHERDIKEGNWRTFLQASPDPTRSIQKLQLFSAITFKMTLEKHLVITLELISTCCDEFAQFVNLAKVLMTDTPYVSGTETLPLTPSKYGTVRRFYIRTGKDKGVPPADQDAMIAANPPEKVFCIPNGDHAVFFSAPKELYRLLTCISGQ